MCHKASASASGHVKIRSYLWRKRDCDQVAECAIRLPRILNYEIECFWMFLFSQVVLMMFSCCLIEQNRVDCSNSNHHASSNPSLWVPSPVVQLAPPGTTSASPMKVPVKPPPLKSLPVTRLCAHSCKLAIVLNIIIIHDGQQNSLWLVTDLRREFQFLHWPWIDYLFR